MVANLLTKLGCGMAVLFSPKMLLSLTDQQYEKRRDARALLNSLSSPGANTLFRSGSLEVNMRHRKMETAKQLTKLLPMSRKKVPIQTEPIHFLHMCLKESTRAVALFLALGLQYKHDDKIWSCLTTTSTPPQAPTPPHTATPPRIHLQQSRS